MRNLKAADVDTYLAAVPEPARSTLQKLRATILSVVPSEASEVISYGIPLQSLRHELRHEPVRAVPIPERAKELPHLQRHHPFPARQAPVGHSRAKTQLRKK